MDGCRFGVYVARDRVGMSQSLFAGASRPPRLDGESDQAYRSRLLSLNKKSVNSGDWEFNWRAKIKKDSQVGKGNIGDPLDRFLTVRDGVEAGIIDEPEADNVLSASASSTNYAEPSPPTSLVLSSGDATPPPGQERPLQLGTDGTVISRIRTSWTASNDTSVIGYDLEFKLSAAADWIPFPGTNSRTDVVAYISPVTDGQVYDVRVRSFNAGFKKSAWLTVTAHLVIGKAAPPPDMTGFVAAQNGAVAVFRWDQVPPAVVPDYQGAEIRYGKRGVATWETALALTKITKGTNITSADLPPGDWRCFLKAVDTSDNYSLNAAQDDLNFVNTYDVITQIEQAPIWPGTLTNFLIHWTGVLVPQSTLAANLHTNAELFEQFVPYPFATCSYEAPEINLGIDGNVRIWGVITAKPGRGVVELQHDAHLFVDVRTSVGSYDGFEEWTIGNRVAQYFKYKFELHTAHGKAYIESFMPVADSQENIQEGTNIAVSAGGTLVTFPSPYYNIPIVDTPPFVDGGALRIAVADSVTVQNFIARIYTEAGVAVAGTLPRWRSTGV